METMCMKGHILFSGTNKKNILNLLSAEFAQSGKLRFVLLIDPDQLASSGSGSALFAIKYVNL